MAYTFNTDRFTDVRAIIGLDVTIDTLPDETLALPVYQGEAERFIDRSLSVAQYTSFPESAEYAAILYLASLVVPTLRIVEKENIVGGSISYTPTDLRKLSADLRERAGVRISEIVAESGVDPVPTGTNLNFFGVARRRI